MEPQIEMLKLVRSSYAVKQASCFRRYRLISAATDINDAF